MKNRIRILHVSDVHFGEEQADEEAVGEQRGITKALISAAHDFAEKQGKPDICIFSGDLAQRGNNQEFKDGEEWLANLIKPFGCPLFIVPGNHDVQRPPKNSEPFVSATARLHAVKVNVRAYNGQRDALETGKLLETFVSWHQGAKTRIDTIVSDWQNSIFGCSCKVTVTGNLVHLIGLNTAIASCSNDDKGRIVGDVRTLNTLLDKTRIDRELVVVVTHHPVRFPGNQGENWIAKWNNELIAERLLRTQGPQLYLHGHLHRQLGTSMINTLGQQLVVFSAGAAYQTSKYPRKFAFYTIDLDERKISPATFGFDAKSGEWLEVNFESRTIDAPSSFPRPIQSRAKRASRQNETKDQIDGSALQTAYKQTLSSVKRLVENIYPESRPRHDFSSISSTISIDAAGVGHVRSVISLVAGPKPVHFWQVWFNFEEDSPPLKYYVEMNLNVRDLSPKARNGVAFLPSRDDDHDKEITVFFLPHIDPGESRTLEITYRWPGNEKRLTDGRPVEFAWGYANRVSSSRTPVIFTVKFHANFGKIDCTNNTVGDLGAKLVRRKTRTGGTTWTYRHDNALVGKRPVQLTFAKPTTRK